VTLNGQVRYSGLMEFLFYALVVPKAGSFAEMCVNYCGETPKLS
jgi:hypothetical protein